MKKKIRISWKIIACILIAGIAGWWLGKEERPIRPKPITMKPSPMPKSVTPSLEPGSGELAFVIDDWGYNLNNLPLLSEIKVPMTLSILPHLRYSSKIASNLAGKNYEIILHMPMEAHNPKIQPERETIYTTMAEEEIRRTLDSAVTSIPFLTGVSNHMGSRVTEDPRVMRIILERLKEQNLYFLDSLVTPHSVVENVGKQVGIRWAKRSIFLDNHLDADYIREQIEKMAEQAKENGQAIGIGHDRPMTLEVIREMIPELKAKGYRFVYVSQLTQMGTRPIHWMGAPNHTDGHR